MEPNEQKTNKKEKEENSNIEKIMMNKWEKLRKLRVKFKKARVKEKKA